MSTPQHDRPIMVGIDGSMNSLTALRWALREGIATGAPVEVVHCWIPQTFSDLAFGSKHELQVASECMLQNEVAAATAEVVGKADAPASSVAPVVTTVSLHGNAADLLVERSVQARMIVLGARQTTAMSDLFRGTVQASCRKRAACPVVTLDRHHAVTWFHPVHERISTV